MAQEQWECITGTVEDIVYKNEDTGFAVIELASDSELITVVGTLPLVGEGEELTLNGRYVHHPTFGVQFKAQLCERKLPASANAIYKYLASGAVKGIGPATARKIVDAFGDDTLEVLEKTAGA